MSVDATDKELDFDRAPEVLERHRKRGERIVLCHGVFDLLHPGHLAHLQEAKALGDVLVVSITPAEHVNRGPGRPIFSDDLRLFSLAGLACVDYVVRAPGATALEVIDQTRPDLYCKGREYADPANDVTQNIDAEAEQVRAHGGDIAYTGQIVFSSSRLINNHTDALSPQVKHYSKELSQRHPFEEVRAAVEAMQRLKVLVLGDIIIDDFIHCNVQGLTSKGRIVSSRFTQREQHLGGSLAIARHIASFAGSVTVMGMVGNEPEIRDLLNGLGRIQTDLQYADDYTTIVKRRYVERLGKRNEYNKLFAISHMHEDGPPPSQHSALLERLARTIDSYDLVVVADYGHGLMAPALMDLVQERAPFLALNCQTNSGNYGFNLITKYRRADTFCLDETEIRLAFANRHQAPSDLLRRLQAHLGANQGWLTLGSVGSLATDALGAEESAPALTLQVTDTIGAGDAFFALASMSARLELPLAIGSFLGNMAGAMAANVLGNALPVEKAQLLKFATTLLKF
jgi:rfaE bifunctional protein nucleotidyltransferase chain/domain